MASHDVAGRPTIEVNVLRELAIRSLARMYKAEDRLFAFRLRRHGSHDQLEGASIRYTAIALIGLSTEDETVQRSVLAGTTTREPCARLVAAVDRVENLGDVALILWAATMTGHPERASVIRRLLAFQPDTAPHPTVEVAWTLAALCSDADANVASFREKMANRLISAFAHGVFPHRLGERRTGLRAHVSCFADIIYPIHALALYASLTRSDDACDVALRCARQLCENQGPGGQWWWHYDRRTGRVLERYPVYAIHQDAMAPMALFALQRAAGVDMRVPIARGLDWLACAPETNGTLVDSDAGVIWRKIARREPAKLSRYLQAAASRVHPAARAPGVDRLFPPLAVDYEDRPYHLGWLLHAWPSLRAATWRRHA